MSSARKRRADDGIVFLLSHSELLHCGRHLYLMMILP